MTRFAATRTDIIGIVPQSLPTGGLDPCAFAGNSFDKRIQLLDQLVAGAPTAAPNARH